MVWTDPDLNDPVVVQTTADMVQAVQGITSNPVTFKVEYRVWKDTLMRAGRLTTGDVQEIVGDELLRIFASDDSYPMCVGAPKARARTTGRETIIDLEQLAVYRVEVCSTAV